MQVVSSYDPVSLPYFTFCGPPVERGKHRFMISAHVLRLSGDFNVSWMENKKIIQKRRSTH